MVITEKTEVSTKEIAIILGVTARWVQQLTQDGVLSTIGGRSRYSLAESIQAYIEYRANKEPSTTEVERIEAELSIKKANAIIKVLEAKELQGKMHRSEDVAAMTEDLVFTTKGMISTLPGRLAVDVIHAEDSAEAAEVIRKEVYAIMKELSNYQYDPREYEERVRERRNWELNIVNYDNPKV